MIKLNYNNSLISLARTHLAYTILDKLSVNTRNSTKLRTEFGVEYLILDGGAAIHYLARNIPQVKTLRTVHDIDIFVRGGTKLLKILCTPAQFAKLQNEVNNLIYKCGDSEIKINKLPWRLLSKQGKIEVKTLGAQYYLASKNYTHADLQILINNYIKFFKYEPNVLLEELSMLKKQLKVFLKIEMQYYSPTQPLPPVTENLKIAKSSSEYTQLKADNVITLLAKKSIRTLRNMNHQFGVKYTDILDIVNLTELKSVSKDLTANNPDLKTIRNFMLLTMFLYKDVPYYTHDLKNNYINFDLIRDQITNNQINCILNNIHKNTDPFLRQNYSKELIISGLREVKKLFYTYFDITKPMNSKICLVLYKSERLENMKCRWNRSVKKLNINNNITKPEELSDKCKDEKDLQLALIISGANGAGKTTFIREVLDRNSAIFIPKDFTGLPKKGEVQGRDYYFISNKLFEMRESKKQYLFISHSRDDNQMGIRRMLIDKAIKEKHNIAIAGGEQTMKKLLKPLKNGYPKMKVISLYIITPSFESLVSRLSKRAYLEKSETNKVLTRLENSVSLIEQMSGGEIMFDYYLVNDTLESLKKQSKKFFRMLS